MSRAWSARTSSTGSCWSSSRDLAGSDRARRPDLGPRPDRSGRARTRVTGSAGSTSRRACSSGSTSWRRSRVRLRGGRPARDGRLEPRARGDPAHVRAPTSLHVLDTTHPSAIRRLEEQLDLERTLFIAASKSGTTLETRSQLDYFLERGGGRVRRDHRSRHRAGAVRRERTTSLWVVHGEPTIGGRYSALSPFGIVPAVLIDVDVAGAPGARRRDGRLVPPRRGESRLPVRAGARRELDRGPRQGLHRRDSGRVRALGGAAARRVDRQGGQGARARSRRESGGGGPDRQHGRVRLDDPYDLGAEFFRWEFATAVAGSILGINPFNQPDVQAAKDKTSALLSQGTVPEPGPEGSLDDLLAERGAAAVHRDPGVHRPRARGRPRSARRPRARDRLRRDEGPRAAVSALDRAAAQGRAEQPCSRSRSSTTSARSSRSRARTSVSGS